MTNCWLVVFRINVALAILQPYLDLEAGDNQSEIVAARPGIEPSDLLLASQELNNYTTTAPHDQLKPFEHVIGKKLNMRK